MNWIDVASAIVLAFCAGYWLGRPWMYGEKQERGRMSW